MITASIGEYEKAYCNVTVKQEYLAEYACSLQCESLNLYIGDDYQLNATVRYGDEIITGAAISWYSSDMTVATVSKGVVKAVGSGEAVITAEFQAEDIKVFAQCKVNVLGFYDVSVLESATGIVANIGDTFNVTMEVYDANGDKLSQLDEKLIRYYSANENIVSYINGKYKAMSAGVTNLIVEYAGVTNVCPVRVGITTEAFQLISGGVGSGVRVSENGYFLYESKPSVDQETYVALSGEEWESALSKAKEKGYTKVSVTVYSINGVMKPRPCNTQYSVFDVEDDVFWLTRDKNVPFKETKLLSECENWPFMLFGMYGEGSFEFTISFE